MDLVSHRSEASPELWKEALAVAEGLRAPEAKKEKGPGGKGEDEGLVRSDALFGTWAAEDLAVRSVLVGHKEKGASMSPVMSCPSLSRHIR